MYSEFVFLFLELAIIVWLVVFDVFDVQPYLGG